MLTNPKHELFAQALAEGLSADAAYQRAGYRANRGNAITLKANQNVRERLAELQSRAAERAEVTAEDIARQLDEDRDFARQNGHSAAAVSASLGKAKVLGLIIEKVQAQVERKVISKQPLSEAEWEAQHAHSLQ